jgi:hypothetical protein
MKPTTYQVKVRVYINEMMEYYKRNPEYGSREKPYPADFFHELIAPYCKFYGPLRNILVFEKNCNYRWEIRSDNGTLLQFSSSDEDVQLDMELITNEPSEKKWQDVFINAPIMQPDGKLKVKSKSKGKDCFELETTSDIEAGGGIKYSFLFEFTDAKGDLRYGSIDPIADTYPPPPPDLYVI